MFDDCVFVIRPADMTTPPWWREKAMVYYRDLNFDINIHNYQDETQNELH